MQPLPDPPDAWGDDPWAQVNAMLEHQGNQEHHGDDDNDSDDNLNPHDATAGAEAATTALRDDDDGNAATKTDNQEQEEEEEVCRVCRSGAPEDGPLFWPCLCSGSMKYVHESCLNDWVRVSKKNKCELCHTPLHYTQVYSSAMPSHLPPFVLLRHLLQSLFSTIVFLLRAIIVAVAWLAALPYAIVWVFRFYTWTADGLGVLALVLCGGELPAKFLRNASSSATSKANATSTSASAVPEIVRTVVNMTTGQQSLTTTPVTGSSNLLNQCGAVGSTPNFLGDLSHINELRGLIRDAPKPIEPWKVVANSFASDMFKGQVITSIVVVLFVIGFLVREWILTNAPQVIPVEQAGPAAAAPAPGDPLPIVAPQQLPALIVQGQVRPALELPDRNDEQAQMWHEIEETLEALAQAGGAMPDLPVGEEHDRDVRIEGADHEADEEDEDSNEDEQVEAALTSHRRRDSSAPLRPARAPAPASAQPEPPILRGELAPNPPARPPAPALGGVIVIDLPGPAPIDIAGVVAAAEEGLIGEDEFLNDELLDDFEGVLEAIGMRGSIFILLQNLGLMILLVSLCLGAGMWLPMGLGRMLAGADCIKWITLPLRMIRVVSDPAFDAAFATISYGPKVVLRKALPFVQATLLKHGTREGSNKLVKMISDLVTKFASSSTASSMTMVPAMVANATTAGEKPLAAQAVKTSLEIAAYHWKLMAHAEDSLHRALCAALGYASVLLAGAWYVQSTDNEYSRTVNRAIREGITQQLTLLKVCFFVAVEIVLFPATCGLLVSFSTYHLFPNTSIASRLAYLATAPFSGFFITWLAGTFYMFAFSAAIDAVRDAVRPGLIWFIKDPQSHDFHPIREILERTSATQAKKILTSVILYGGAIFLSLAANVLFLRYACVGVLPLRWPTARDFSLPLDLLIYRFVVPFTIRLIEPRSIAKKLWVAWARRAAHELRLSSFLFGERDPTEEGTHVRRTWRARLLLKRATTMMTDGQNDDEGILSHDEISSRDVLFVRDGGFGRVPAVDTVRTAPGRAMIVHVTERGFPLTEQGQKIVDEQVQEMATSRKRDAYQVVYLPPWFKTRVLLWCYLSWLSSSCAVVTTLVLPLLTGRYLLSMVTSAPLHDFYAVVLGAHVLGLGMYLTTNTSVLISPLRSMRHFRTILTTLLLAGVLVPLALGLSIEAYCALPLKLVAPRFIPSSSDTIPTMKVLHSWSLGVIAQSLLMRLLRSPHILPPNSVVRMAQGRASALWTIRARIAALSILNNDLYLPLFLLLAPILVVPTLLGLVLSGILPQVGTIECVRLAYALVGSVGLAVIVGRRLETMAKEWVQRRKEIEYLVERRLRNYVRPGERMVSPPFVPGDGGEATGA